MERKRILFIDDDIELQSILTIVLEDENVKLINVTDIAGIEEVLSHKPDLILLDEWLLNKNGSDICIELKSNPETVDIPVILVSAVPGIEKIAGHCKADAFISKPFDIRHIIRIINSFLFPELQNPSVH